MNDLLTQLESVLRQRKTASPDSSYVAGLYEEGLNRILEKVGEEATEVIIAAKDCIDSDGGARQALIRETADLWFHTLVMLSHLDLSHAQVLEELSQRFNISGLDEKASRNN